MAVRKNEKYQCYKIEINGVVQGVGFRPFIYRLALKNNLKGYILNNSSGVEIEVEGYIEEIDNFLKEIQINPPPLAEITGISKTLSSLKKYDGFTIRESKAKEETLTLISPDISICDDCIKELFNTQDRRYLYPFINCTNCGPRYTIIEGIPYDRKNTSMKVFKMCRECQSEYDNPLNRRFHAQPNACPKCGPHVKLIDNNGNKIVDSNPLMKTIELLKNGRIVAIKGLGGFHLACDAENDYAVKTLRKRKHREEKPLAIMSENLDIIESFARVSLEEKKLLCSPQRPIVLLRKKIPNSISGYISPGNNYFGVMLPYTPLHYILLRGNFKALVMTSGNLTEEPIAFENMDALKRLNKIADYFLVHNREIYIRNDDSVYRIFNKKTYPIRRSRGYVPFPVFLKKKVPSVLGCGAELKNTICLTKGDKAFLSQHIGDMENYETLKSFEKSIEHLKNILEIEPEIIAYDLHPDYLSTKYALNLRNKKLIGVQHHFAHILSCMAENQLEETVIGISIDGTGYGTDGNIWGGEFLIVSEDDFERVAHFEYVPMPGGEKAIKEPWRMGLSYLYHTYGDELNNLDIKFLREIDTNDKRIILRMIEKNINSPLTSSCGRLFDGVASLISIRQNVKFEGQAAIELENKIPPDWKFSDRKYHYNIFSERGKKIIKIDGIIRGIVIDIMKRKSRNIISYKFH
ncbi:carbamoyltransferase HypF, partial [candidate division KSB1 bacterium]